GMLGRMMNLFGGKAMREGVTDTVVVKGNRKLTMNDTTGRIIDLDEEKVYDLDIKSKSYKVMTFDDLRRQLEEQEQRAKAEQQKSEPSSAPKSEPTDPNAKQMQIDFDLKETGQKKNINGFDTREVVMTITVHEKDKPLEQAGGMVMTTHQWLGPRIAALKEIADFDRRYQEKLNGPSFAIMPSADQMAAAAAMYPMLTQAIGKFNVENVNMDGTAIQMIMTTEAVASPEELQKQQQQQQSAQTNDSSSVPTSVGGLIGGLGRRAIRNRQQQQQQQQQANTTPGRSTIMTMNHEVLKVATDATAADVAIPAGFKQKK
ncbi:MAG TPA: hypothetical protein VGF16_09345, partial [Bryobacteraceae bacterium]